MSVEAAVEASGRVVERAVEIEATPDAVWRALTDARELERWFPLEAEVVPGEGGRMRLTWGEWYDTQSAIEAWSPGRHLRILFPSFAAGQLATDYWLEGRGGRTRLRVVSSGFGPDADWDEAYEGVSRGWDFELAGLRHYLERHAGEDRAVAYAIQRHEIEPGEAWRRLTGAGGWLGERGIEGVRPGARWSGRTVSGEDLSGTAVLITPPRQFVGTVDGFGDALLRVGLESGHAGRNEAWVFMSTWGQSADGIDALSARWRESLFRTLG